MILLRFLSTLAGLMVLVVPPMFMFSGQHDPAYLGSRTAMFVAVGFALVTSTFFFIAFAGGRMRKSKPLRTVGMVLLAAPFAATMIMLWRATDPAVLWMSGLLLCFTVVLLLLLVFPGAGPSRQRSMRAREPREPKLAHLWRG